MIGSFRCTSCGYTQNQREGMVACEGGEIVEVEVKPKVSRKEWKTRAKAALVVIENLKVSYSKQIQEIQRLQNENDYLRSRVDWKGP